MVSDYHNTYRGRAYLINPRGIAGIELAQMLCLLLCLIQQGCLQFFGLVEASV